jgi:hypothetical protein
VAKFGKSACNLDRPVRHPSKHPTETHYPRLNRTKLANHPKLDLFFRRREFFLFLVRFSETCSATKKKPHAAKEDRKGEKDTLANKPNLFSTTQTNTGAKRGFSFFPKNRGFF